jgi:hypothetical protein
VALEGGIIPSFSAGCSPSATADRAGEDPAAAAGDAQDALQSRERVGCRLRRAPGGAQLAHQRGDVIDLAYPLSRIFSASRVAGAKTRCRPFPVCMRARPDPGHFDVGAVCARVADLASEFPSRFSRALPDAVAQAMPVVGRLASCALASAGRGLVASGIPMQTLIKISSRRSGGDPGGHGEGR